MVIYLAFRNIAKNIKDSSVIFILIAVITFLLFIGNNIIEKADQNIRKAYIESLTGDVVLQKDGDVTMNLFGANVLVIDSFFNIPVLPAYDIVKELLSKEEDISGITSQVSGIAYLDALDVREPALLCGIDPASYFKLFPGIYIKEGRYLQAGEFGAMITEDRAHKIEVQSGRRPEIGMPLLFTSGGPLGFKIREVPLVGVFNYQNPGQFMNEIIIIDPQTVRVLNSIQAAGFTDSKVNTQDLFSFDADDIFSDSFDAALTDGAEFSPDILKQYLSMSDTDRVEMGGDWNFIIIRLNKGVSSSSFISSINKKMEPYGITAVNWRIASGNSAIMTLMIQALFNSGIFLVSIVGAIAIINILLISVFQRTREIGTLRTIGASNIYIRSLIYWENIIISAFAGLTGVLLGFLFIGWINSLSVNLSNELLISILNGTVLHLEFMPHIAGFSFVVAVLLGLAASIYPVETAVRLEPMAAIRRG